MAQRPIHPGLTVLQAFSRVLLLMCSVVAVAQAPGGGSGAVPAARHASNVAVITITGEISGGNRWVAMRPTLDSIYRRMQIAQRAGADAIVFELDTPGGNGAAALAICKEIKGGPIRNTVAWVHPNAISAGAVIALACREIVVSDPSSMGDAVPIFLDPMTRKPITMSEAERQKQLAPVLSELVDSARRNHYDEFLVQGIPSLGVELWLVENKETGKRLFINRAEYKLLFDAEPPENAPSVVAAPPQPAQANPEPAPEQPKSGRSGRAERPPPEPIPLGQPRRLEPAAPGLEPIARSQATEQQELASARPVLSSEDRGKWRLVEFVSTGGGPLIFTSDQMLRYGLATAVIQNDEELKKFFGAKNIMRLDRSWSEGLVVWLTWMPVRALLVVVFLLALFVEMTHPGVMLPGAIALVALIGLVAPPLLINLATWWTLAAICLGILLITLEVFVLPGFGVAGVCGLLLLFAGLLGTLVPAGAFFPDSPQQKNDLLYGVVTLFLSVTTAGVGMYFVARNFRSLPLFNRLILKDPVFETDHGDELLAAMGSTAAPVRAGMTGSALTPLRPAGRVELEAGGAGASGGRIIDVVSEAGYIPAGARVRVVSVSDFRIGVEPAPVPSTPPGDAKA